jgi:DNA-binding LytR/AlgR family response regulator
LKREQPRIIFRDQGKVVQVRSTDVLFMQAANNNVEIHTRNGVFHPRMKLGDCMNLIPDKLEYMQIHRSYIVRIDQIDQFDRTSALIGDQRIPVGPKYQKVFVEFMTERS